MDQTKHRSEPSTHSVIIGKAVVDFTVSELLAIHELCDKHSVPRKSYGELLSVSQRVVLLAGMINAHPAG